MRTKECPGLSAQGAKLEVLQANVSSPRPNTKIHRVLSALATGRSFNRFEAERELNDHTLNSTVSEITTRYGITIQRREETVPGFQGAPTRCCRYWLDDMGQLAAQRLTG